MNRDRSRTPVHTFWNPGAVVEGSSDKVLGVGSDGLDFSPRPE